MSDINLSEHIETLEMGAYADFSALTPYKFYFIPPPKKQEQRVSPIALNKLYEYLRNRRIVINSLEKFLQHVIAEQVGDMLTASKPFPAPNKSLSGKWVTRFAKFVHLYQARKITIRSDLINNDCEVTENDKTELGNIISQYSLHDAGIVFDVTHDNTRFPIEDYGAERSCFRLGSSYTPEAPFLMEENNIFCVRIFDTEDIVRAIREGDERFVDGISEKYIKGAGRFWIAFDFPRPTQFTIFNGYGYTLSTYASIFANLFEKKTQRIELHNEGEWDGWLWINQGVGYVIYPADQHRVRVSEDFNISRVVEEFENKWGEMEERRYEYSLPYPPEHCTLCGSQKLNVHLRRFDSIASSTTRPSSRFGATRRGRSRKSENLCVNCMVEHTCFLPQRNQRVLKSDLIIVYRAENSPELVVKDDIYYTEDYCADRVYSPNNPIDSSDTYKYPVVYHKYLCVPFATGDRIIEYVPPLVKQSYLERSNITYDSGTGGIVDTNYSHLRTDGRVYSEYSVINGLVLEQDRWAYVKYLKKKEEAQTKRKVTFKMLK